MGQASPYLSPLMVAQLPLERMETMEMAPGLAMCVSTPMTLYQVDGPSWARIWMGWLMIKKAVLYPFPLMAALWLLELSEVTAAMCPFISMIVHWVVGRSWDQTWMEKRMVIFQERQYPFPPMAALWLLGQSEMMVVMEITTTQATFEFTPTVRTWEIGPSWALI